MDCVRAPSINACWSRRSVYTQDVGTLGGNSDAKSYICRLCVKICYTSLLIGRRQSKRFHRVRLARLTNPNVERRHLLRATVLVAALFSVQTAATASSLSATETAGAESHNCKCGTRCRGASCCCAPRKPPAPNPEPDAAPAPVRTAANPCSVDSAPCGDPFLPSSASRGPEAKNAALSIIENRPRHIAGSLLPVARQSLRSLRRISRLDRPPDNRFFA